MKPNGTVDIHNAMQPVRDALYLRDRAVNLLTSANTLAWLHFDAEEGGGDDGVNGDGNGGNGAGDGGDGGGGGGSDVTSRHEFVANGGGSAARVRGANGGPVGGHPSAGITAMDFDAVAAAAAEVDSQDWPTLDESNERRRLAAQEAGAAARGGARASGMSAEANMAVVTTVGRPDDFPHSHEPSHASTHASSSTVSDGALIRAAATAVHNAAAFSTAAAAAAAPYAPTAARPTPLRGTSAAATIATAQSCDAELKSALLSDLHVCDDMDVATDAGAAGVGTDELRDSSAANVNAPTPSCVNANGASAGHGGGSGGANAGRGVARRRFERTEGLLVEKRVWDEREEADVEGGSPKREPFSSSLPHDSRQVEPPPAAVDRSSGTGLPGAASPSSGEVDQCDGDPTSAGQKTHPQPRQSAPLPPSPPPTRLPQDTQERGDVGASTGGAASPTGGKARRKELGQSAAASRAFGPSDPSHRPSLSAGLFQGTSAPPSNVQLLPEMAAVSTSANTKSPAEAAVEAVAAAVAASGDETGLGAEETGSNCIQS